MQMKTVKQNSPEVTNKADSVSERAQAISLGLIGKGKQGVWYHADRQLVDSGLEIPTIESNDCRNYHAGRKIPVKRYNDQPYVVITPDGNWLCAMTVSDQGEGGPDEHMVATISADQGRSWSPFIDIEPPGSMRLGADTFEADDQPTSVYGVPLVTPYGRVYVFYTFNGDRIISYGPNGERNRSDVLGWYVYRYSDDCGHTWSDRHRLPMRVTAADRENPLYKPVNGTEPREVQTFWGIDKPIVVDGAVMFAFSKRGAGYKGEGFIYRSDNILHERDPQKINWQLLPDGDRGIRDMDGPDVQDEHNIVPLSHNGFYCMHRTDAGYPMHSYSRDGGHSWTKPVAATYTPGGKIIRHPRACPMVWKTSNGRYLFWYHNNGEPFKHDQSTELRQPINNRNLVWLAAGREVDGYLHWSQPELIIHRPFPWITGGPSYPDLIEQDGGYFITSGAKVEARVTPLDTALLNMLWNQHTINEVAQSGLVWSEKTEIPAGQSGQVSMPPLPNLAHEGGFSLDIWLNAEAACADQVLLDARDGNGKGWFVKMTSEQQLLLTLRDGAGVFSWDTDPGLLVEGQLHHVVFIVDGSAKLISSVVNGCFCDGGEDIFRPTGYARFVRETRAGRQFEQDLADINGAPRLTVCSAVRHLRMYNRYLLTSEAIGNFRAGIE